MAQVFERKRSEETQKGIDATKYNALKALQIAESIMDSIKSDKSSEKDIAEELEEYG